METPRQAVRYGAILADPPWQFPTYSAKGMGRSPDAHYDTMPLDRIATLPVGSWAASDCVLFLWVTNPLLPEGLRVMSEWRFTFKTVGFTWVKTTKDGLSFPIGTGYWTRANPELCLLGTRGSPKRLSAAVRNLIIAPRREHSVKSDEAYERVEQPVEG